MKDDANILENTIKDHDNNKIEIYRCSTAKKPHRKKIKFQIDSDDEEKLKFKEKKKNKNNDNKKGDSSPGRKRGNSHKIKKAKANELIISDIDDKEKTMDKAISNPQLKIPKIKSCKTIFPLKRHFKKKKKVTFKTKFVNIIEVESYKKYNVNMSSNDDDDAKCSCSIC